MSDRRDVHSRELLSAYLDGELADAERAGVEEHVSVCASCRGLLDDFKAMAVSAMQEQPPPVPGDLRARIRVTIGAREAAVVPARRRVIGFPRLGLAAAAGIVIAIGIWTIPWQVRPPASPPVPPSTLPDTSGTGAGPRIEARSEAPPGDSANRGEVMPLKDLGYIGEESRSKTGSPSSSFGRVTTDRKAPASPSPATAIDAEARDRKFLQPPPAAGERAAPSAVAGSAPAAAIARADDGTRDDLPLKRKETARRQAEAPTAAPLSQVAGAAGQVLVFERTGYRLSAQQDGLVVLSTEGFTCSVRRDGPSVDPDIAALFVLAASAGKADVTPAPAGRAAAVVRLLGPQTAAEQAIDETKGKAIETRFRTLLQDRYLPLMESRCGAVPRIVRSF